MGNDTCRWGHYVPILFLKHEQMENKSHTLLISSPKYSPNAASELSLSCFGWQSLVQSEQILQAQCILITWVHQEFL